MAPRSGSISPHGRAELPPRPAPPAAVSVASAALGETILVVEDDPRVRRVAVRRLKELGYAVIEADSGPAALRILDREEPLDLLFTDIVMAGGITGVDLAQEARRRRPGLKILFTSGYAEPAVSKGALAYVECRLARQALQHRRAPGAKLRGLLDALRAADRPQPGSHGTGEDVAAASDRLD